MKKTATLAKLFMDLVQIPSPSGQELKVGNFIKSYLNSHEIEAEFDASGKINNSDSGNLIAQIKGNKNAPTLLFLTHMDTVEVGDVVIKPKLIGQTIKSDGTTILGADNKASVACLMEALVETNNCPTKPNIIAVFSTHEEKGQMGGSLLKLKQKIDYSFNVDGAGKLGRFIYRGLGQIPFEISIVGKEAHAGIEPENGINAIQVAAEIISKLKQGRTKSGGSLNIGQISGGKSTNIVPGQVTIKGEVREFTQASLDLNLKAIEKIVYQTAQKHGAKAKLTSQIIDGAPPMLVSPTHPITKIAASAATSVGVSFLLDSAGFTSEGNYLSAMGYPVLTVCRGGVHPHSTEESITVAELEICHQLILSLIATASKS